MTTRPRAQEGSLLLGIGAIAASVVLLSVHQAVPPSMGWWLATSAALATALAAFLAVAVGTRSSDDPADADWDATRGVLSALPDGLLILHAGVIRSVNRRFCDLVGLDREELLGATAPFPFWPPERRHELERWHSDLDELEDVEGDLTFRRRDGERIQVLLAGRVVPDPTGCARQLVTVRDVSTSRRRERRLAELSERDPVTGLVDRHGFEAALGDATRRAVSHGHALALALLEVGVNGNGPASSFRRPEALLAVERLRELVRPDDTLARTDDGELAWILPETNLDGCLGAVARARAALATLGGVTLTVGVCELASAGDVPTLYAFADRALVAAREQGPGGTAEYRPPEVTASLD